MANPTTLAILMPIHNGLEYTKRTLGWLAESIERCGREADRISVVITDDGSTDGSGDWIREHFPNMHVLQGNGNLWWSGSINMAAEFALHQLHCDWLVLWNNDIKADVDYFSIFLEIIAFPESYGLIGSKIYLLCPPNQIWAMGVLFNSLTGKHTFIGSGQIDEGQYEDKIAADWTGGMGTAVHREVVDCIGLWDASAFPQYHGDSDFCLRAKSAGFRLVIHPRLRIWNDKSSSGLPHQNEWKQFFLSFFTPRSLFHLRTQIRFYMRHGSSPIAWCELFCLYFGYIGGFLKWKFLKSIGVQRKD